jgi:hypothetical protein
MPLTCGVGTYDPDVDSPADSPGPAPTKALPATAPTRAEPGADLDLLILLGYAAALAAYTSFRSEASLRTGPRSRGAASLGRGDVNSILESLESLQDHLLARLGQRRGSAH